MDIINVSKKNTINTIKKALSLVTSKNMTLINIDEGVYNEKITIDKDNIILKGKGINKTIITFDDYSKKIHQDGRDFNTFRTPTLKILGNNCKLFDLTIENSSTSKDKGQAIALANYGNKLVASNIKIISEQDSLFLGPLPDDLKERYSNFLTKKELFIEGNIYSKFSNCIIQGNIDFIFGCGEALFNECEIISSSSGYVTAPSHSMFQNLGFIFNNCHFKRMNDLVNDVNLSRLWRPYGKVYFINCFYDQHINKEGATNWNNKYPQIYSRIYEYPKKHNRVDWINNLNKDEYKELMDKINKYFNF